MTSRAASVTVKSFCRVRTPRHIHCKDACDMRLMPPYLPQCSSILLLAFSLVWFGPTNNQAFRPAHHRDVSTTSLNYRLSAAHTSAKPGETKRETPRIAYMFPGQGSQYVGMGITSARECEEARKLFDQASDILGYNLLSLCTHGPSDRLANTDVCQPAILVCSMAAVANLQQRKDIAADCALGLSLGEYSALCYAEAISFEDAVRVTDARGKAMQAASMSSPSGMVSVVGVSREKVEEICDHVNKCLRDAALSNDAHGEMRIANYLCPGNYACSGPAAACDLMIQEAKRFGAKLALRLPVSGAFHSPYMEPATERLANVLSSIRFSPPRVPVVSNVDAEFHERPDEWRRILEKQLTSPVHWEESVRRIVGHPEFVEAYELGPGQVLAGTVKRIDKSKKVRSVE